MPRGNKTGPDGIGPMTGRGAGFCSGSGMPGYMNQYGGRGYGFGRGNGCAAGYGRGMGHGMERMYAPSTPETEKKSLEREAAYREEELKAIRKRLDDLDAKAAE